MSGLIISCSNIYFKPSRIVFTNLDLIEYLVVLAVMTIDPRGVQLADYSFNKLLCLTYTCHV